MYILDRDLRMEVIDISTSNLCVKSYIYVRIYIIVNNSDFTLMRSFSPFEQCLHVCTFL